MTVVSIRVMTRGMLNGSEVILELLRTQGTDCILASPIAVMAPLWEALAQRRARGAEERPRYLQCRHESLVSLASGYYKATGRAQVVFLPTGLGVLHGAMALRTALQERVPMTVLSPDTLTYGEVPEMDPGPEWPSLLIDQHGPARDAETCVKWAKEAKTPADLVHELRRALYFAETIPRGPTLLTVPFDQLLSPTPLPSAPRIEPHPVIRGALSRHHLLPRAGAKRAPCDTMQRTCATHARTSSRGRDASLPSSTVS
jgi:acetolactate synthase-1/2/3 large subunit